MGLEVSWVEDAHLQSLVGLVCRHARFDECPERCIVQIVDVRWSVSNRLVV